LRRPQRRALQEVITHVIRCTRGHDIRLLSLLSGCYPCYPAVILVIPLLSLLSGCYPCYPAVILVIRLLSCVIRMLSDCYPPAGPPCSRPAPPRSRPVSGTAAENGTIPQPPLNCPAVSLSRLAAAPLPRSRPVAASLSPRCPVAAPQPPRCPVAVPLTGRSNRACVGLRTGYAWSKQWKGDFGNRYVNIALH